MKMSTKLLIAGAIFFVLAIVTFPGLMVFAIICFMGGLFLLIIQGVAEIINKSNTPKNDRKNTYTQEAWRSYEDAARKRQQDNRPPWEKR